MILPQFKEGVQFRRLKPKTHFSKYRFETKEEITVFCDTGVKEVSYIKDQKDTLWITIHPNRIIISKFYQWNGCSPKGAFFGVWIGPPDFKGTHLGTLIHDALLQFRDHPDMPISRYNADKIFKAILKKEKFCLGNLYFWGARLGTYVFK